MKANHTPVRDPGLTFIEILATLCGVAALVLILYSHLSIPQVQATEEIAVEEQVSADSSDPGNLAIDIVKVYEFATYHKVFGETFIPKTIDEVLDAIRKYPRLLNIPPPLKHALEMRLISGKDFKDHLILHSDGRLESKSSE